ncbi:MAG: hypothetical protein QW506_00520 [Thermoproteota archaeon]|nr:hypothetical protein [Candidatus Brockarchaeota archaeon]
MSKYLVYMSTILSNGIRYRLYSFRDESELEDLVIEHIADIFTDQVVYFDVKRKLKGRAVATVPDGFMIDLSVPTDPVLYLVEFELARHPSVDHIGKQLLGFELSYSESRENIYKILLEEIARDKQKEQILHMFISKAGFNSVDALIYELVYNRRHSLLVIIDEIDEDLKKAQKLINADIKVVKVSAYTKAGADRLEDDYALLFTELYEERPQATIEGEVETWYDFFFEPEQVPDEDKESFFKRHGINPFQAYVYIRNEFGEIEGIVFQGYKSRIDAHLAEGRYVWGTRRPVNVENLSEGMKVYVVETDYDVDTGKRIEKPKLRMVGRLKEVWLTRNGQKIEKLFP